MVQPSRYSRRTNLFASSKFVNFSASESHCNLVIVRSSRNARRKATFPSSTDSVSGPAQSKFEPAGLRSEEHTSELQSRLHLVCRLLLEKKKKKQTYSPARIST